MPTIGETDPEFMDRVEAASREYGINVATVVGARTALGIEGNLLDQIAPPIEWDFTPSEPEHSQN